MTFEASKVVKPVDDVHLAGVPSQEAGLLHGRVATTNDPHRLVPDHSKTIMNSTPILNITATIHGSRSTPLATHNSVDMQLSRNSRL